MFKVALLALSIQADPSVLLTIHVEADRQFTREHTITISPPSQGRQRDEMQRDRIVLNAVRAWDGGYQSMTSEECPAVARVAASIDSLPPIPIAPPSRSITEGPFSIPPSIKDGFMTTLSLSTLNKDGSTSDVSIRGGTAYQKWGTEAVNALITCWGPLTP